MATDRIQTGIRFPETLLRKITYIARKNHRSLNAQLEHLAQLCVMSTNSRTVLSSFPPMKSNALHITRDSIRIFVPLRPLYGVPVYPSVGGDARIAPRQVRWCPGGQDHPPYDGTSGTAFSRSTGNQ